MLTVDEGHVVNRIERREKSVAGQRADFGLHRKFPGAIDQLVARLPVGDQFRDRDALQLVALGKSGKLGAAHHRTIVIHQFRQHAHRRHAGQPAHVDAGFGMARAHQDAAFLGDQRKHVPRPYKVRRAGIAVGQRPDCIGPLLGRNSRGQAVADIDRNGEGRTERRVIERHHRIEMQPPRLVERERRADDARRVADDERHLFRRAQVRRDKQIAFILAVIVIGDDDNLATAECRDGGANTFVNVLHSRPLPPMRRQRAGGANGHDGATPTWPR